MVSTLGPRGSGRRIGGIFSLIYKEADCPSSAKGLLGHSGQVDIAGRVNTKRCGTLQASEQLSTTDIKPPTRLGEQESG